MVSGASCWRPNYADAIDLRLLRQEQSRISQRTGTEARRRSLAANLGEWRAILETAGRFATNCGAAYRHADPSTRKLFNSAVIDRIEIRDGHIAHVDYRAPFDLLFGGSGFEYRTVVELRGFEPLTLACHRGIPATAARDLGAWSGRGPLGRRRRRLISAALGLLDLGVDVGTEPGESEIRAGGELVPFGGQVDGEVLLDDGG
jgi:hypothetical protein